MATAAFIRRQFKGNVSYSDKLASGINSSQLSITLTDGTTFPDGSVGPFVCTIEQGTAAEEQILVTSRSGATLTLPADGRGWAGTTAQTHLANAAVIHSSSKTDLDEANQAAFYTLGKITALGDLLVGAAANQLKRLGLGSAYQNLGVNSGGTDLAYQASMQSLLTAAGDLPYASGANTPARLAKGTDGQVLTLASGLPSWATTATPPGWTLDSTLYARTGTGYSTVVPVASEVHYIPILIATAVTATRIAVFVETAGAGSTVRLGIYAPHATTRQPDALVVDGGTVATATTNLKTVTISTALTSGLYWLACAVQGGTPPTLSAATNFEQAPFATLDPTVTASAASKCQTGVAGAFGATASASTTRAQAPIIFLRG